jgi:hypothetical protein
LGPVEEELIKSEKEEICNKIARRRILIKKGEREKKKKKQ